MTKRDLIDAAGMTGETIDFGRPQLFDVEMRRLGADPHEFVWHYPQGSIGGVPLSNGALLVKAMKRGELVRLSTVECALDAAFSGDYSKEKIIEMIKNQCNSDF